MNFWIKGVVTMRIRFKTDGSVTGKGWRLNWLAVGKIKFSKRSVDGVYQKLRVGNQSLLMKAGVDLENDLCVFHFKAITPGVECVQPSI